jgi:hypothetical protein
MLFAGGGTNELMVGTRRYNTGIAARGRIFIANDNKVCAFTLPVAPIVLWNMSIGTNGAFQFSFTNTPGMGFTVFSSTNVAAPLTNWISLGVTPEVSPGQFQFSDPEATNMTERFYCVRTP